MRQSPARQSPPTNSRAPTLADERLPLTHHLAELRTRIFRILLAWIVGAALALDGDDYLFSATQTVPEESHLGLTNGAYWTVRRDGTHLLSDWDWELVLRAWGCAAFGTL